MPITIEGTPFSTSAVKRIGVAEQRAPAKLSKVDACRDADRNAHRAGEPPG